MWRVELLFASYPEALAFLKSDCQLHSFFGFIGFHYLRIGCHEPAVTTAGVEII